VSLAKKGSGLAPAEPKAGVPEPPSLTARPLKPVILARRTPTPHKRTTAPVGGWSHHCGAQPRGNPRDIPKQPVGVKSDNWIHTVPSKGRFTILRLCGPLEPFFDQNWRRAALGAAVCRERVVAS